MYHHMGIMTHTRWDGRCNAGSLSIALGVVANHSSALGADSDAYHRISSLRRPPDLYTGSNPPSTRGLTLIYEMHYTTLPRASSGVVRLWYLQLVSRPDSLQWLSLSYSQCLRRRSETMIRLSLYPRSVSSSHQDMPAVRPDVSGCQP